LGQAFNFNIDCFVTYAIAEHIQACPNLELKTWSGFILLAKACPLELPFICSLLVLLAGLSGTNASSLFCLFVTEEGKSLIMLATAVNITFFASKTLRNNKCRCVRGYGKHSQPVK
jgi:hypothetical protein